MILGIDTSLGTSVAIVSDSGQTLAERASTDPYGHTEVIGSFIEQCLLEAAAAPHQISALAIGLGPGPFTGLRVGIAAARTFALGSTAALIGVPSHDAAAFSFAAARGEHPDAAAQTTPKTIAIVTDARRRELAVSSYQIDAFGATPLAPATLIAAETVADYLNEHGLYEVRTEQISAAAIALVGRQFLARDSAVAQAPAGAVLEPIYLREPDARPPAPLKRVGL